MTNLVPTKSEMTAVTTKSWIAVRNTPPEIGMRVCSDMLCIMVFISSSVNVTSEV